MQALAKVNRTDVALRMRQTRELWDESFYAETWFTMSMGYLRRIQGLMTDLATSPSMRKNPS